LALKAKLRDAEELNDQYKVSASMYWYLFGAVGDVFLIYRDFNENQIRQAKILALEERDLFQRDAAKQREALYEEEIRRLRELLDSA
jgi:hypothetical protein